MADIETGLSIPVSAYADEDSAKKAIQDLTKSILGALKDGYIEIPTAISDEFDKSIMEFEYKFGVYEKSQRYYLIDGLCPTLTTSDKIKIIIN